MAITKIFYHTDFENHIPTLNNPECSKRVANIINLIKEENFANISFVEPNKIKKELIYAAHDKNLHMAKKMLPYVNKEKIFHHM